MKIIAIISHFMYCCLNNMLLSKRSLLFAILSFSFFMTSAQTFCEDISGRDCDNCPNYTVTANPDLTVSCDQPIDVILIIDESNSIGNENAEGDVQLGVETFLQELECTPVRVAIIEFGSRATFVVNSYTPVASVTAGMSNYFNGITYNGQTYDPDQGNLGGTNWQAALVRANSLPTADLVLMFTDGVPTTYSPDATGTVPGNDYSFCDDGSTTQEAEIYNAVQMANILKAKGSHMFILGVGDVDASLMNDISDTDQYGPTQTIATADYYVDPNFSTLAHCFASLANSICPIPAEVDGSTICATDSNGTISVTINPGAVGPFDVSGAGFPNFTTPNLSFTISNLAPGNYGVTILDTGNPSCFNTGTFPAEVIGTPETIPTFDTVEICAGDIVDILTLPTTSNNGVDGIWAEDNGVFTFTPNQNECAEETVLVISEFPVTPDDAASGEACVGNTYEYEGVQYEIGSHDIPRTDVNGCPYKTVLTVSAYDVTPDDVASGEVCVGNKFTYEGLEYEVGSYDIPRTDVNGCPYKTVLTVSAYDVTPDDAASGEVCVGNTYEYEGIQYEIGSHDIPRTDVNGCPYKTVLTVSAYDVTPDDAASGEVCVGNTYEYEGVQYEIGSHNIPRTDVNGCPYKTVLTVSAYDVTPDDAASGEVCVGNTYEYEGVQYEIGSHDIPRTDVNGCPYKTVLTVSAYDVTPDDVASGEVCVGNKFTYEGLEYEVGSYDIPRTDVNGCPYKTVLTVSAYDVTPDDAASGEVCVGNTYEFEGIQYAVGTHNIPKTDANGCPYTTVLTVTAYEVTEDIVNNVTVCEGDSHLWLVDGLSYTIVDSPVVLNLTDSNGCPYTATLTITEDEAPDAGNDGTLTVCADVVPTNEDLFDALLGTPNEGGTWSGPLADVYTYTFA
ncbi:VWA domain-containing protein, partial [Psychroserpens sp. AS72]|uniref:VWA domain-containing protein n=1 Tax=Psychroserpens sp. AS72 TaxID=3135775 RepID=UPI00318147FB